MKKTSNITVVNAVRRSLAIAVVTMLAGLAPQTAKQNFLRYRSIG